MGIAEKDENEYILLKESKTEYNLIRKNLSHYLLKNFSENVDAEYPQRIFETGKVAKLEKGNIIEEENLSIGLAPGNFTELKQILEFLFRMLNIPLEILEEEKVPTHFIDGRTGKIILNKEKIGALGEVHPKILKKWKIKMPLVILEINLEKIFEKLIN